jgi:hypothetical protein
MRPWLWALAPCVPLLLDGGRLLNQNNMHRPTQSHTQLHAHVAYESTVKEMCLKLLLAWGGNIGAHGSI